MYLLKIMSHVALAILVINVILYLIGFSKNGKAYKVFSIYLLSIALVQGFMALLAAQNINNHFVSTYYLFFQFILLSCFFYNIFGHVNQRKSNVIKYVSGVICACLLVQYIIYPESYYTFNSIGFLITSVILIIYSVLYLYEMLTKKLLFYYVTIGIFIYLISSSLIFATAASIVSFKDDLYLYIWKTNAVLFIIYQLLILWEWKQQFLPKMTKQR